jgi:hypothetical protein
MTLMTGLTDSFSIDRPSTFLGNSTQGSSAQGSPAQSKGPLGYFEFEIGRQLFRSNVNVQIQDEPRPRMQRLETQTDSDWN